MKRIAVVTGLAGAMVAGHERIYHRVLAKATDQAGSVGSEQPRYWPVRWSAPFLVWSPRRRHPGRVAHQHSGWALEILANPPSSRHWLAAPQRRPSAAASWGSPLPGQRLAGTAARPSRTPRMAEGSSAILGRPSLARNHKPGSGQRPVADGCRHGDLGSSLPVGLGSDGGAGSLRPGPHRPAPRPCARPHEPWSTAAQKPPPTTALALHQHPLGLLDQDRWPSAHRSCSASSP
jgi:hypothetical protein